MTSLADYNIGLNVTPPANEPGVRFELIKECFSWEDVVTIAIQNRKTHPDEPVEVWNKSNGTGGPEWMVVREVKVE